jgi:hypothetical protein
VPEDGDISFDPDFVVDQPETGETLSGYRTSDDRPLTHRYLYEVAIQLRRVGTDDVSIVYVGLQGDDLMTMGAAVDAAIAAFPKDEHPDVKILGGFVTAVFDRDKPEDDSGSSGS